MAKVPNFDEVLDRVWWEGECEDEIRKSIELVDLALELVSKVEQGIEEKTFNREATDLMIGLTDHINIMKHRGYVEGRLEQETWINANTRRKIYHFLSQMMTAWASLEVCRDNVRRAKVMHKA
jgi:hypothetical protein